MLREGRGTDGFGTEADRVQDIGARDRELERLLRISKKNMLALVRRKQDGCTASQCRELECQCRRPCRQLFCSDGQHMSAP